ncbi:MAG TPA: type II toxin-antitoxin system prevent-host-death family antitoxin [Silvibacterium sp.]|nr:type II toxin-antitoxin system prevent-host-death family antitoxin [Silvibacterium sp.]
MQVSVADAKNRLPQLLRAVEDGEQITICRRGVPIVELVPATKPAKKNVKLGTMRDRITIHDPDWWKPMSDEEVEAFLNGSS